MNFEARPPLEKCYIIKLTKVNVVYFMQSTHICSTLHLSYSNFKMASAIPKYSLVLVTGVHGFLSSHIADQFLEAGYRVRGTTRDVKKVEGLKALWEKYGPGKLEIVIVQDMLKEGAFDEAVKGTVTYPFRNQIS